MDLKEMPISDLLTMGIRSVAVIFSRVAGETARILRLALQLGILSPEDQVLREIRESAQAVVDACPVPNEGGR